MDFDEEFFEDKTKKSENNTTIKNYTTLRNPNKKSLDEINIEILLNNPMFDNLCKLEREYYNNCVSSNMGKCNKLIENLASCLRLSGKTLF